MRFGVAIRSSVIPGLPASERGEELRRLALAAEDSGFDSIWVPDRTVFPTDISTRYPDRYGASGSIPDSQQVLEPVTAMSFLAGSTSRIKLGFNVLVLPFRNPVLNAKMVTTLDVLSGGRVIFGVGVGWMPEEFEAMSASYADRGALTDEHIEMFKALCAGEVAEYAGRHFSISERVFYPKPLQKPHPPIWIGGKSRAALRRVARLGDGWLPIGLTPDEVVKGGQALRRLCEEADRDPDTPKLGLNMSMNIGEPQRSPDGERVPLTGQVTDIIDDVRRYRDAGLELLVISMTWVEPAASLDGMKRFAEEVAPKFP
jgi:probable F420-dependent oxidoreductase